MKHTPPRIKPKLGKHFTRDMSDADKERFWSKVDMTAGQKSCWPWIASCNHLGYGKFKIKRTVLNASRVAWEVANGQPLGALVARHKCDNPSCCNPAHIEAGTQAQNLNDALVRGRHKSGASLGECNPMAKINAGIVLLIRQRIAAGHSNKEIATDLPISSSMVSAIRRRKAWALVGMEGIEPPTYTM